MNFSKYFEKITKMNLKEDCDFKYDYKLIQKVGGLLQTLYDDCGSEGISYIFSISF